MRKSPWFLVLLFLAAAMVSSATAGSWNTNSEGVVLGGYDVVAYHAQDLAVRGSSEFSAEHGGVTFYFASRSHLEQFRASPERYAPKYGGYCAFGVAAHGAKVPTDPRTFKIHDGKLLLFFNDLYEGKPVNTKIIWNQNEAALYAEANDTWKTLD